MMHSPMRALRQRCDDAAGVSLVEMLVAIIVLSVGILALASAAFATLSANGDARNRQLATDAMTAAIESARAESWDDLAMDTADIDVAADPNLSTVSGEPVFDHDGSGPDPAEVLIHEAGGTISPYITQDETRTIRTYVTWFDPDGTGTTDSKRVTVVATYAASGTTRELRESTVVAEANRGLAAPDFTVAPDELTVTEQAGQTVCFEHSLINDGEQDKHSFTIDGWDDFVDRVEDPLSDWVARAFVDGLQMTDTSGDLQPDSAVFLPRGGSLPLEICYDVPAGLAEGSSHAWTAEFTSALDPTVVRTVTNTLVVGAPGSGPSTGSTHPGFLLRYNPDHAAGRTFVMNSGDILRTALSDYDVGGLDADALPGWKLKAAGNNPENHTRWDWQYTGNGNATLDGTATLRFYSASTDALQSDPPASFTLDYELELQVLDTAQQFKRTLVTTTDIYSHTDSGWVLRTVPFDFSTLSQTDKKLKPDEYLRLVVNCRGGSSSNCHMAFDALVDGGPTYSSALDVPGASS